jgi:membrane protease YdiL (CAAX protease family)
VEPPAEPPAPPAPTGRKSALAFFAALVALFLPGAVAQTVALPAGLAWTELFGFLLPAVVATSGSNLRVAPFLRLRPARPAALALGALAGVAGYAFAGSIMALTQRLVPQRWVEAFDPARLFEGSQGQRIALAAVAILLAPLCEEVAFRGYIQTALGLRHRPALAIAGGAALFALLHVNPVLFPALVVLGAVFGWLTWRAGSVWPAILAHAVNNGITSALVLGDAMPPPGPPPLEGIALSVLVGGAILLAVLGAYRAVTPRPPPPAEALVLRDPGDPSIRFSPVRVPASIAAAVSAGMLLLAVLFLAATVGRLR